MSRHFHGSARGEFAFLWPPFRGSQYNINAVQYASVESLENKHIINILPYDTSLGSQEVQSSEGLDYIT